MRLGRITLEITVDELLAGVEKELEGLSYSKAGVDIAYRDAIKREMKQYLKTSDPRVLNGLGPFVLFYMIFRFGILNIPF
ncbi:MAG: hypothetical protein V8R63_03335 [Thomasclavelia ramosa]